MNGIRVSVDLPASLKTAAERHAGQAGVSLNQFIAAAVAEKVGAVGAAEYFEKRGRHGRRERGVAFLRDAPNAPRGPHGAGRRSCRSVGDRR